MKDESPTKLGTSNSAAEIKGLRVVYSFNISISSCALNFCYLLGYMYLSYLYKKIQLNKAQTNITCVSLNKTYEILFSLPRVYAAYCS